MKKIAKGRSMKNFDGVLFSKPEIVKNRDNMILSMVKIPSKIRFSCHKNRMINCQEFRVELLTKVQNKIKTIS